MVIDQSCAIFVAGLPARIVCRLNLCSRSYPIPNRQQESTKPFTHCCTHSCSRRSVANSTAHSSAAELSVPPLFTAQSYIVSGGGARIVSRWMRSSYTHDSSRPSAPICEEHSAKSAQWLRTAHRGWPARPTGRQDGLAVSTDLYLCGIVRPA